jgi:hypothetical protein
LAYSPWQSYGRRLPIDAEFQSPWNNESTQEMRCSQPAKSGWLFYSSKIFERMRVMLYSIVDMVQHSLWFSITVMAVAVVIIMVMKDLSLGD